MFRNLARHIRPARCAVTIFALCVAASAALADSSAPESGSAGPRKSVAVAGFDGSISFEGGDAAQGLTTMLTDALIRDGRFVVVERAAIADVSAEHQREQGSAMAATQLTPANVLVRGTVTKFAPKAGGGGLSAGFMGAGSLGGALGISGDHSDVEINLRLIDTATGRILSSTNVKGSASSEGVTASVYTKSGMTFGGNEFSSSPLGKACEQAIQGAIVQIASAMNNVAWSAQVLSSDTGQIYIDAGTIQNIQVGEAFKVYHKDKVLTDPATGAVVDVLESPVGSITIVTVREKTSAGIVTDGALPARGDIVRVN
jgi:curli biogenesis system outer membrane secretion channel CsgG